jgi:hypothetical protein
MRRAPKVLLPQPRETSDWFRKRDSRIHERLKGVDRLEGPHTDGAELADAGALSRETRRLEVEHDELRFLEQGVSPVVGQGNSRSDADDATVPGGHVSEQRTGETLGDRRSGEEGPGRVRCGHGPPLLERVHQQVERVQRKLHVEM